MLKFILHFKSLQVNEGYMMLIIYPDISTRKLCNFSNFLTGVSFFSFSGCQLKIMLPSLLCKIMSSLTLLEKYAFQSWMATTPVFLTWLLVHLLYFNNRDASLLLASKQEQAWHILASKLCGTTFVDSKLWIDKERQL